ncbi:hypothetical protein QTO34_014846 [Cnephaeus nilssonii]|uniref:Uncharacterized protein n=1 Tax=Cnephaeus nilssonii TaxID=3371016 RepID=A0AA40LSA6_CNENI|nr:hypothetical protein QTO34_014846 [Eptesicus nilssonii]
MSSKVSRDPLRQAVREVPHRRQRRRVLQTVGLQISLKNCDPQKDRRSGHRQAEAHSCPTSSTCDLGDQQPCAEATAVHPPPPPRPHRDMRRRRKNSKRIRSWPRSVLSFGLGVSGQADPMSPGPRPGSAPVLADPQRERGGRNAEVTADEEDACLAVAVAT